MKRLTKFLAFAAFIFVAQTTFGQGVVNSSHNFAGELWTPNGGTCIVCHTPHNAIAGQDLLWNHDLSGVVNFTPYQNGNGTIDAVDLDNTVGNSAMCLSCHDGTVSIGKLGGAATLSAKFVSDASYDGESNAESVGYAVVGAGGTLASDHPVGFTYDGALDAGLEDPTQAGTGPVSSISADMLFGAANDQMECATCHDVHDTIGSNKMLRVTNTNSALCTTCHIK